MTKIYHFWVDIPLSFAVIDTRLLLRQNSAVTLAKILWNKSLSGRTWMSGCLAFIQTLLGALTLIPFDLAGFSILPRFS